MEGSLVARVGAGTGLPRQIARFGVQAVLSAVITLGLPALLHEAFGVPVEGAVAAALAIAFVFNFLAMRLLVFRSAAPASGQFLRYACAAALSRLFEYGLFLALHGPLGLTYLPALAGVLVTATVLKFTVYQRFVFGAQPPLVAGAAQAVWRAARALFSPTTAIALAVAIPVVAFLRSLYGMRYAVQDDARQHVTWFARYLDGARFSNDFIADYFMSSNYPLFRLLYTLPAQLGMEPLALVGPYVALNTAACALGAFLFARHISGSGAVGAFAAIYLALWLWADDYLASASARSFAWSAFIWFLFLLASRRHVAAAVLLVAQSALYPMTAVMSLCVLAISAMLAERLPDLVRLQSRASRAALVLGAVGVAALLAFTLRVDPFGPTIGADAARALPEAGEGRLRTFFHERPLEYWLLSKRSGLLPRASFDIRLVALVAVLSVPLLRGPPLLYRHLAAVGLSGLGLWALAHATLFELYLPGRFPTYCLGTVFVVAAAAITTRIVEYLRVPLGLALFVPLWAIVPGLWFSTYPHQSVSVAGAPRILETLARQGPPGLVGGFAPALDNIPTFAGRGVVAAPEFHHWYKVGYHTEISRRIARTAVAVAAPSPDALLALSDELGIAAWVMDWRFQAGVPYLARWLDSVLAREGIALDRLMPETGWLARQTQCAVLTDEGQSLYWTDCLRSAASVPAGEP